MKRKTITIDYVTGGWSSKPREAEKTGTWRTFRPMVSLEKCVGCGLCEMYCPEASINIRKMKAVVNYDYCKGCGICENECPQNAIEMIPEVIIGGKK